MQYVAGEGSVGSGYLGYKYGTPRIQFIVNALRFLTFGLRTAIYISIARHTLAYGVRIINGPFERHFLRRVDRNGINDWDREGNYGGLPPSRRQPANQGGLSVIRAEFVRHPD